jgi:hypothetical protein
MRSHPGVDRAAADPPGHAWTAAAYLYGLLVALVLGYFLFGLVVQVSDSFGNLLAVQEQTLGALLESQFTQRGYLRPFLWAQIKIAFELADGHYYLWFRGIHALQVAVLVVLCIRLMRPVTRCDAALVPLALAALVGSQTFAPTVREAFPINTFMTIMICCVAAANLSFAPSSRWWRDALAVLLLVFAALTVESGLLVWIVCAGAYVLGARGVSRGGVLAMTGCVLGYVVLRFWVLGVGGPGLAERSAVIGFTTFEPAELTARFSSNPWPFYAYNVVSSVLTVLFAEPVAGAWSFVYQLTVGDLHPWTVVSVLSSSASTILVGWFLWSRRSRLRAWSFEHDDRLVLLFLAVLAANAVISYPYTKNAIMSPAGVFFAVAVFAAARHLLTGATGRRLALSAALIAVLGTGWAYRTAGLHYNLRFTSAEQRTEWVHVDRWLALQRMTLVGERPHALRDALRADAIWNRPIPPQPSPAWMRWFIIER